jgi:hypothetical protein
MIQKRTHGATALLLALMALMALGCGSSALVAEDGGRTADGTLDQSLTDLVTSDQLAGELGPGKPLANVFPINPIDDNSKTTEVELTSLTDPEGRLVGKFANTWNCLNTDGGDPIDINLGGIKVTGKLCKLERVAKPGADGTYRHILPSTDADPDDPFAEVMMYYHVTAVHDRFKESLGLTHMDKPLRSIVNVQAYLDLLSNWVGLVNAAFVPKEGAAIFKSFGIDLNQGEDAIIFIQGNTADTAYDATVIYHEYTHAVIGLALSAPAAGKYGVDPTPGALNEALADYFAASFLNTPVVGAYALGSVGAARDLTRNFKCPDHIVGEVHHDGEVAAGALWAMRSLVGVDTANQAIANAVLTFTQTTTFEEAAIAILDELKALEPSHEAAVKSIFEERGLLGCVPLREHENFAAGSSAGIHCPGLISGTFVKTGAPSPMQYRLALLPTTKELTLVYTATESGIIPFLPAGKANVAIAFKPGKDPIVYDYGAAQATSNAVVTLKGSETGASNTLVLRGNCLDKGDLVFQFVNLSGNESRVGQLSITQSPTTTLPSPNFDLCS